MSRRAGKGRSGDRRTSSLLDFVKLFPEFQAPSWAAWRGVLARLGPDVREFWAVVGRGAGKSRIVALIACWFATKQFSVAPGERIYIGVFAPDRKQAAITFRYIVGLLRSVPELEGMIGKENQDSVDLVNAITIEVITASIAAPRGRSYALAVIEEAAFLPSDQSAKPDVELIRAVRPALARVPGSLLAVVGSPYARRGILWQAAQKYRGKPDGVVVFVQEPTLAMNQSFDAEAVAAAYEEDPAAAAAEFGAEFRSDVENFITREALDGVVVPGRLELPLVPGVSYRAFTDPSGGGGGDSFTCAVSHVEKRDGANVVVLDAVREIRPPFSPESAVVELSSFIKSYGVSIVVGDRYAGEWPREAFRRHGVEYRVSERSKSDLYRDVLPLINSGRTELLDVARLTAQFAGLERRTARGGRDSIDHGPGSHDDVANVVAGVLVAAHESVSAPQFGMVHALTGEPIDETALDLQWLWS